MKWWSIACLSVFVWAFLVEAWAEERWWAFEPPVEAKVPVSNQRSPVDAFLKRRLDENGLTFSEESDRLTLLRRLFLVVLGVPPEAGDIEAMVNARGPLSEIWPQWVDRALGDPRWGERLGQHWLDVIRWAETVGFETNAPRPNAWRYRDWVIDSLNEDMPYDVFLQRQLVGDQWADDAALGFLVAGPANLPGQIGRDVEAMRQARQDELDEVVRTVSQAFLGLTIGCARCHDHKFDPISARDYYSLQAVFAGLRYGDRRLRGPENDRMQAAVPAAEARLTQLEAERERLRNELNLLPSLASPQTEEFDPRKVSAIRMVINATTNGQAASLYELEAWTAESEPRNVALASAGAVATASSFALENQTRHPDCLNDGSVDLRQAFPWRAGKGGEAWVQIVFAEPALVDRIVWHEGFSMPADYAVEVKMSGRDHWQEVAHSRRRFPHASDTRSEKAMMLEGVAETSLAQIVRQLAEIRSVRGRLHGLRAGPQVYAAGFVADPGPTFLLNRGDPMQRREEVPPGVPVVLGALDGSLAASEESARRAALAHHLTDPRHPLVARVLVNRVWQQIFGTGLVDTPSDFGKMGSKPSHPELLDWLALEFVRHEWSLKWLYREILVSHAFRQSDRPDNEALAIDANARLLWRFPPRRIEAEALRDSLLALSGQLNRHAGGVGFDFFRQRGGLSDYHPHETFDPDGWRRMVYARKIRMQAVPIFGGFDCPDAGQMTPKRTRSITPLQALSLMNSPFVHRQADFFATRLQRESGGSVSDQVRQAIRLAFSRDATDEELERLITLTETHGLAVLYRVLVNTSEFLMIP